MLSTMTWRQFQEWEVFSELEPFDEKRQDIRTAVIVATLANQWRGKNQKALSISKVLDDLFKFGDDARFGDWKQPVEEQMRIGRMMAAFYTMEAEEIEAREAKKKAVVEAHKEKKSALAKRPGSQL